jgi:hypothetical protein
MREFPRPAEQEAHRAMSESTESVCKVVFMIDARSMALKDDGEMMDGASPASCLSGLCFPLRIPNPMTYKGYLGRFEFDSEAGIFHGEVSGLRDVVTFQGRTLTELENAFHESVDDYLDFCENPES